MRLIWTASFVEAPLLLHVQGFAQYVVPVLNAPKVKYLVLARAMHRESLQQPALAQNEWSSTSVTTRILRFGRLLTSMTTIYNTARHPMCLKSRPKPLQQAWSQSVNTRFSRWSQGKM